MSWKEFGVEEEMRGARVLVGTLNCRTGGCNTEGAWRPAWAFICSHGQSMPLLPEVSC